MRLPGAGRRLCPKEPIPREIRVLIASAFVIAIGFGLITPVLPQFAQSFGVGATAASIVVSTFALFRLLFAPGSGRLITSWGERPVYLVGLVLVAVSTGATAFAGSYWQLVVFRGLGGIGSTLFTVSATALIVRLAPPGIRGRVASAYGSAFLLGGIAGPAVGGALAGFGLRVPFLIYAAALLVAAALVAVLIRPEALRPPPDAPVLPPLGVREAWQDSAFRAACLSGFANGWTNYGVRSAILPLLAVAVVGAPWGAGLALATFAGGIAVGLNMAGRGSDLRGRRPYIIGGLVISGVLSAVTGLAGSLPVLVALCLVGGVGAGALAPAQQAAVADMVGRERGGGPTLAAFQMCQDAGTIIGPVLAGLLVDNSGYPLAFASTGAVALLAVLPWLRARETAPRRTDTDAPEQAVAP